MDRASWLQSAHGGELAGMELVAKGSYTVGGGWELYCDPTDPTRHPRLRTWPDHPTFRGMVSLGGFGPADGIGVWSATSFTRDQTCAHRALAVSAVAGTVRVVVTDSAGAGVELAHLATHPDGRTELFVGASTVLAADYTATAFGEDGAVVAWVPHHDRHP